MEETEIPESDSAGAVAGADPAAIALTLAGASRAKADAFLDDQRTLIDIQKHHLNEQFKSLPQQLRLALWEKRLSVLLRVVTVLIGVGVAAALAFMVWDATQAQGLVIEAFSVPPDLAARGLSGEVVATRFLDQFKAMQTATVSERPADTYQYNWDSELKVEIPQTGLTFGELGKLLRDRFGHAAHVTGEVVRTEGGIAVTARLGDAKPQTFSGPESDFDKLARQAAEAVYRTSQPYRFAQYVAGTGRNDEALGVIADLATNGPVSERGWAYTEWGMLDQSVHGDLGAAIRHCRKALSYADASTLIAEVCLVNAQVWLGHDESVLNYSQALAQNAQTRGPGFTEDFFESNKIISVAWLETITGDIKQSAVDWTRAESTLDYLGAAQVAPALAANAMALDHDPDAAARSLADIAPNDDPSFLTPDASSAFSALPHFWIAASRGDWNAALADARAADAWLAAHVAAEPLLGHLRSVWIQPLEALALAKSGDAAGGWALIRTLPIDCYLCVRVRGQILAVRHDWAGVDYWFVRAVQQAPSPPFAYAEWGAALLERGDAAGAIEKFKASNARGPHFADPLEGWGEALMAQNRSDLAVAKFEEAEKDAPNWGRLHLKWGEALGYAGQKDEAKKQFAIAAGLDLTAAEKAELAKMR